MSMDKAIGSVFGAAASATKMLTVDSAMLTMEEVKARILLAILVGIPGRLYSEVCP